MKIIISPSKTQKPAETPELWIPYVQRASIQNKIIEARAALIEPLKKYACQKPFDELSSGTPALLFYTGLVYKQLSLDKYDREALEYIHQHLILLSAYYGYLNPFETITAYRLDYKTRLPDIKLYDHWKLYLDENLPQDEIYINLASDEFSKNVSRNKINIHFREIDQSTGRLINKATFSKMARGRFLDEMIMNQLDTLSEIKKISFDGYHFSDEHSSQVDFYYIR